MEYLLYTFLVCALLLLVAFSGFVLYLKKVQIDFGSLLLMDSDSGLADWNTESEWGQTSGD